MGAAGALAAGTGTRSAVVHAVAASRRVTVRVPVAAKFSNEKVMHAALSDHHAIGVEGRLQV